MKMSGGGMKIIMWWRNEDVGWRNENNYLME